MSITATAYSSRIFWEMEFKEFSTLQIKGNGIENIVDGIHF